MLLMQFHQTDFLMLFRDTLFASLRLINIKYSFQMTTSHPHFLMLTQVEKKIASGSGFMCESLKKRDSGDFFPLRQYVSNPKVLQVYRLLNAPKRQRPKDSFV